MRNTAWCRGSYMTEKPYYIYMVQCAGGTLYTGIAADPARRLRQHLEKSPAGAKYTRSHSIEQLLALWRAEDKSAALRMECAIKRLKKVKKQQLAQNAADWAAYLPALAGCAIRALPPVTLEECMEGKYDAD